MTVTPPYTPPNCERCGRPGAAFGLGLGGEHLCISCAMGWTAKPQVSVLINGEPMSADNIVVTVTGPDGEALPIVPVTVSDVISSETRQQVIADYLATLVAERGTGTYFLLGVDANGDPALMDVTADIHAAMAAEAQRIHRKADLGGGC